MNYCTFTVYYAGDRKGLIDETSGTAETLVCGAAAYYSVFLCIIGGFCSCGFMYICIDCLYITLIFPRFGWIQSGNLIDVFKEFASNL